MRFIASCWGAALLFSLSAGCGGAPAHATGPAAPADATAAMNPASHSAAPRDPIASATPAATSAPPSPNAARSVEASADAAESSFAADTPRADTPRADAPSANAEPEARSVKYIVSPEGLRVELEGVSLRPRAEVVPLGKGFGVKVSVEARAKDGQAHSLLAPKDAELAFAGSVWRIDGQRENFSDQRTDEREVVLAGSKPRTLSRTWRSTRTGEALSQGDTLKLSVGLWGIGTDAGSRRPLNRLCSVSVKFERGKPRASVAAPEGLSK